MKTKNDALPAVPPPSLCSPSQWLSREELIEAHELMLECAEKLGIRDAEEGVDVPPAEFCTGSKSAEMLRQAWLMGFHSANTKVCDADQKE